MKQLLPVLFVLISLTPAFSQSIKPSLSLEVLHVAETENSLRLAPGITIGDQLTIGGYYNYVTRYDWEGRHLIGTFIQYSTQTSETRGWVLQAGIGGGTYTRSGQDPAFRQTQHRLQIDASLGRHLSPRWTLSVGTFSLRNKRTGYDPYTLPFETHLFTRLQFRLNRINAPQNPIRTQLNQKFYLLLASGNNLRRLTLLRNHNSASIGIGYRVSPQFRLGLTHRRISGTEPSPTRPEENVTHFRGLGVHALFTQNRWLGLIELGGVQNVERGWFRNFGDVRDTWTQTPYSPAPYIGMDLGYRLLGPVYLDGSFTCVPFMRGRHSLSSPASETDVQFSFLQMSVGLMFLLESSNQ